MNFLITALITTVTTFIGFWGVYNYAPIYHIDSIVDNGKLGAITTILGTDTLSDSRTTINNNFTDLDTTKMEMSTTSVDSIITLSNLSTVGTITSGIWNGTAIPVGYGGTGTTSPSTYLTIIGNGANGFTVASTTGTSGQFWTSQGEGAYPQWTTAAINEAGNYNWTGTHSWTGNASSSILAVFNTLYVGTDATSTIQGSTSGTSALQGYLNILGTAGTSTFSGGLLANTNLEVTSTSTLNGCEGCLSGYERIVGSPTTWGASSGTQTASANCTTGKKVIGGGVDMSAIDGSNWLGESFPSDSDTWTATGYCNAGAACNGNTITAIAICAYP